MLPEDIAAKIRALPESSMGAHKVALVLRDGRIIEDVQVAWGNEVVRVAGSEEVELPTSDIVDVINRA